MLQPKPKTKIAPKKATNKNGIIPPGAEKSRLPFTKEERAKMPNVNNMGSAKSGKSIKKAKNGKSFPDLNKDGKITKADILKGRGVIAKKGTSVKKAKSGTSMKKCKYGCK